MTEQNNFITYSDIANAISQSIRYIIYASLALAFFTIYIATNDKDKWVGKLKVNEINETQFISYNDFLPYKEIFYIDEAYLKTKFLDEISDLEEVRNAIINLKILEGTDFESEEEFYNSVNSKSQNFTFYFDKETESTYLKFISNDITEISQLMRYVIEESTSNVQNFLANKFNTIVSFYERNNKYEIEDIENEIKNVKRNYDIKLASDLAFLREQADIARALGISQNSLKSQISINSEIPAEKEENTSTLSEGLPRSTLEAIEKVQPYYLRGHVAIEKEISLKENRKDVNLFIPKLINLYLKKQEIETDFTTKRLQAAYQNSPIKGDNFICLNYNLSSIEIEKIDRSNFFFLGLLVLSTLFSSFLIILFNLTINHFKKN